MYKHTRIHIHIYIHTYTYTCIHTDMWCTSIHQHTHDHTYHDRRRCLAACNSLSFNIYTYTYTDTHTLTYTCIHIRNLYIQTYDIHLICDIWITSVHKHIHAYTHTCIHTDMWYTSDIWYMNCICPSTHTRPHLPWQKTLPTLLQLTIIQGVYIHIYGYTYIHIYIYTCRYMIYIYPSTHTRPHLPWQQTQPSCLQLAIIQRMYRYTCTDTHAYTHTCIHTDIWYTSDIWYTIYMCPLTHTRPHLPWQKPLPSRLQLSIIQIAPLMQDLQFGQFLIDGWLLVLNSWQM